MLSVFSFKHRDMTKRGTDDIVVRLCRMKWTWNNALLCPNGKR
jgi:hypothetical protein